ncbi:hypothetical protein [Paracoccus endophyticus]|uniref:hypothetical protein n=1 Tax=Paracoccus endophyticus TaxID=2233774 RepID=UPI0013A6B01A|nr:hypothetical protein [Paracoccus endophyticus]
MKSPRYPLRDVLENGGHPVDPLASVSYLLRAARAVSRKTDDRGHIGAASGDPVPSPLIEVVGLLDRLSFSTLDDRRLLRPGQGFRPGKGAKFDFDMWLRRTFILLKDGQCALAARGREGRILLDRYLEQPGWYQEPQGIGEEQLKKTRRKLGGAKGPWTSDFIRALIALYLPRDFLDRGEAQQKADLLGLAPGVKEIWHPHVDKRFPFEIFWLLLDFSLHSDAQLRRTVTHLASHVRRSPEERLQVALHGLMPILSELADLLGIETEPTPAMFEIAEAFPGGQPLFRIRILPPR